MSPLFAPLSQRERSALQSAPVAHVPQQLAALLALHHTRVIVRRHHTPLPATALRTVQRLTATHSVPQDLFRALDKNADGEVTKTELADALWSLGIRASGAELDDLFEQLDPDASGGIIFRELQLALHNASREAQPSASKRATPSFLPSQYSSSKPSSRATSRPTSRPSSQPSSPSRARGRWTLYDQSEPTEATGAVNAHDAAEDGASGMGGAPAVGKSDETGSVSEHELTLLGEMVQVAIAEAAHEGHASGSSGGVTLLRVLSAYEMVLERHGIPTIEDTRHYQLLLMLSLLPQHDWRDKLAAFEAQHRTAVATQGVHALATSRLVPCRLAPDAFA